MTRFRYIRRVLLALGAVVGLAAIYLAFELGRYRADYSVLDHRRETTQLRRDLEAERGAAEELRRQVALLETSRDIDSKTYSDIEASLSELESRIQAQEEELVFYRGIVSPDEGGADLRVQSLHIAPQDSERRFVVTVVLAQAIVHSRDAQGVVTLHVEGLQDGQAAILDLADLAIDWDGADSPERYDMSYEFRYFQGLDAAIELPVGFEPVRMHVEIDPAEARAEHVSRSFEWAAVVR
jgi:hypothetical protein